MGDEAAAQALQSFDQLYQQANGQSPLQQLQVQLANALPYDLEETELSEYKNLAPQWHDWQIVRGTCAYLATILMQLVKAPPSWSWMRIGIRERWQIILPFRAG